jgi:hypothetical protein
MSAIQVFHLYDVEYGMCLYECCSLPSVEMWVDRGVVRFCGLSKVAMVDTVGIHQAMWLVMLEYAKDQMLGVDTPGQQVPPCVEYGTACWLIRKALVSYLIGWAGLVLRYLPGRKVQEGLESIVLYPIRGNLSNCERGLRVLCHTQQGETYGKARHTI